MYGIARIIASYIGRKRVEGGKRSRSHREGRQKFDCPSCEIGWTRVGFPVEDQCPRCGRIIFSINYQNPAFCRTIAWGRWVTVYFPWLIKKPVV